MDILQTILSSCNVAPFCRTLLQMAHDADEPLYLAGGAVRELLAGREPSDWDFTSAGAMQLADSFAKANATGVIILHEDQPTARVAVWDENSQCRAIFDFSQLRGDTIQDDLAARDFSINAIACNMTAPEILDPLGGTEDLRNSIIRAPAAENLAADPLRCLRAYRFMAQLGFTIEPQTRVWLRQYAAGLNGVAGQRIGYELRKLLYPPRVSETLAAMDEDGVLAIVFPELEEGRDMPQPAMHHLNVRDHILESVAEMEALIIDPTGALPASFEQLEEYLTRTDVPPMLLMAALLHDIGKPRCFTRDDTGRIRFKGHGEVGAEMARQILQRFAWPKELRRTVAIFVHYHLRPLLLAAMHQDGEVEDEHTESTITMSALRRLFRLVEPDVPGFAALAIADSRAAMGPAVTPQYQTEVELILDDMVRRYFEYQREQKHARQPLLTGKDLIAAGYEPGPLFSEILEAVADAHADGEIHTRQEALQVAHRVAKKHGFTPPGQGVPGADTLECDDHT